MTAAFENFSLQNNNLLQQQNQQHQQQLQKMQSQHHHQQLLIQQLQQNQQQFMQQQQQHQSQHFQPSPMQTETNFINTQPPVSHNTVSSSRILKQSSSFNRTIMQLTDKR